MGANRLAVNAFELLRQPGSVRRLEQSLPLAELDIDDDRVTGDVTINLTLTSTLDDIDAAGTLEVAWADSCRRCLRPLAQTLVIDVDERYAPPSTDPGRPANPDAFVIENGQLDLRPMVREGVLLGIPHAPLCREDCPGLCPVCGADLSSGPCSCETSVRDERWAALDALKSDELQ